MKRTNIYLTDEQQRRIGQKARADAVTKAEIVRRLLNLALGVTNPTERRDEAIEATFGLWADRSDEEIEEVLSWRRADRFERLGL